MSDEAGEPDASTTTTTSSSFDALDDVPTTPDARPRPVQLIVSEDDSHSFTLDAEALASVLLRDDVANKRVVVVSIAGAFRKGKSFMLDFMLRYLERGGEDQWLANVDEPLTGFKWRGGADRETTGIMMWSEPFLRRLPSGEEVAVVLLDTQGAFDSTSTVKDCATIFALSTMVSSVQLYNLTSNIQEDDLQHLELFTEYGRLALSDGGGGDDSTEEEQRYKPFQKLLFLVRDWMYPYEWAYGLDGGNGLLEKRLAISEKQHHEHQQLREHVRSCFDEIECYLMPHPGLRVAINPKFDGRLSEIDVQFRECLAELIPNVLASENLCVKTINGEPVRCRDLVHYFNAYVKIYQGETLPEPKSMLEATAEANNLQAVNVARDLYKDYMEAVCGGEQPFVAPQLLEREHLAARDDAVGRFQSTRKMGGAAFSEPYEQQLLDELTAMYESFGKLNESKNIFHAIRTPAILFTLLATIYCFSTILELVGLVRWANFCSILMLMLFLTIFAWSYGRFSGEYGHVTILIDESTNYVWENCLMPVFENAQHQGSFGAPAQYRHVAGGATGAGAGSKKNS